MLRSLLLAVLLSGGAFPSRSSDEQAPYIRVESGQARLLQGTGTRSLDRLAGDVQLVGEHGILEAGANSSLLLAWRGSASATVTGPANLALGRELSLALTTFHVAELEVRRGTLALDVAGLFEADLSRAAVQLRALPDGAVEVLNRGGFALELRRAGKPRRISLAPGQRLRVEPPAPSD